MSKIAKRKTDHLRICATRDVQSLATAGFDDINLIHNSLPEINMEEIDVGTSFLGHHLSAPLIVEGMTGGIRRAKLINKKLAQAASQFGVAMGVGSQRAAIENPTVEDTFGIVREIAPEAFLIANLGAPQLSAGYGIEQAKRAVEMISANALAIHLNPLQESIQPEGETDAKGVLDKISEIAKNVGVPVIAKETGTGISGKTASRLRGAGVSAVDVSGRGGTDWGRVEAYRREASPITISKADAFLRWGISTVASLIEVTQSTDIPVISSGGLRDGVHVAKSIALGAVSAGFASPLLVATMAGESHLRRRITSIIDELRTAMFLTGSATIEDLRKANLVISGETLNWVTLRGLDIKKYARRA